ncbi:MAG: hypothetical protein ACYTAS_21825 [Planctomycetota bacterium]
MENENAGRLAGDNFDWGSTTACTFINAGRDVVSETENGTDDIWWILEGQGYPRWELEEEELNQ